MMPDGDETSRIVTNFIIIFLYLNIQEKDKNKAKKKQGHQSKINQDRDTITDDNMSVRRKQ